MNELNLYTFIMDYLEGTYISQIESYDEKQAIIMWIEKLEIDQIEGLSQEDQKEIIKNGFEEDDPSALNGLPNVWHFIVDTKRETAFVNFVNTIRL